MKKPFDLPRPPHGWHYYQPEHEGATQPRGFTRQFGESLFANLTIDDTDPLRTFWRWQVHEVLDVVQGRAPSLGEAREAAEEEVERVRARLAGKRE